MGHVNLTQISNGQPVDAGPVDGNFDAIAAAINGNIDSTNLGSGQVLPISKLMPEGATDGKALVWDSAGGRWKPHSLGLIAFTSYKSTGTYTTTSTTFVDVDATNLIVTFIVPQSGKVLLHVSTTVNNSGAGNTYLNWREGSSNVSGTEMFATNTTASTYVTRWAAVAGLTPGDTLTYKLGWRTTSGSATMTKGDDTGSTASIMLSVLGLAQ